jgi:thymidylate kinase
MAVRIAFVGIDGSGKTSITERLTARLGQLGTKAIALHCPAYHAVAALPHKPLSEALAVASSIADEDRSYGLKLVIQYLQMTLYGPAEESLLALGPSHLVCDRHAIVDTMAYGPVYDLILASDLGAVADPMAKTRAKLDRLVPGGWDLISDWFASHCRRLGLPTTVAQISPDLAQLQTRSTAEIVEALSLRYQTTVPDIVWLVDTPPPDALSRLLKRTDAQREAHESRDYLLALRDMYGKTLADLEAQHQTVVRRLDAPGDRSLDSLVDEVVERLQEDGVLAPPDRG